MMNGRRSLSSGHSSPSKSDGLSSRKRESIARVARRFDGDNLLCSDKNCSFWLVSMFFVYKIIKQKAVLAA